MNKANKNEFDPPLLCIVTGLENSGTTLLSKSLEACIPNARSAFECGILLSKSTPSDFKAVDPFYSWLCHPTTTSQWGLTRSERDFVCRANSWMHFYNRLIQCSPVFTNKEEAKVIDKTPAYSYQLRRIASRVPNTPIFIIHKDPILLVDSWTRRGTSIDEIEYRYQKYLTELKELEAPNYTLVRHSILSTATDKTLTACLRILGRKKVNSRTEKIHWGIKDGFKRDYSLELALETARRNLPPKHAALAAELHDAAEPLISKSTISIS